MYERHLALLNVKKMERDMNLSERIESDGNEQKKGGA